MADLNRSISVYLDGSKIKAGADQVQASIDKLTARLNQLRDAGDTTSKEFQQTEKALKSNQAAMDTYKAKVQATERVLNNLSGATLKELDATYKTLKSDLNGMERGTDNYRQKVQLLQKVEKERTLAVSDLNSKQGAHNSLLSRAATGFNKYFGIMSAGIGVLASIGYTIYSVTKTFMEFEKAVSMLSAITGAVGKDLDFLKQKAKDLGKEYGKSAVEIVDAMKLVGSAKPELLSNVVALGEVTEAVLTLSKATGMDLQESTNSLTTIMNQFGMSSLEADKAINILAAGSKYGAKEVDYLGDSISKVGTVAKTSGLSLEQTTAAMELFGEKGIKSEIAGNGFKRILVELQSDTKNYKNGVFDLNTAIENNQKISGDNIALQKKFGVEYFNLAQILLQNKDRFAELTKQVTGTTVAEEQMRIATDNLSGDMDKMKASWNTFILSLEDGKGPIATTFRELIQWAKDSIDVLTSLTKSASQKQQDAIRAATELRMKDFQDFLSQQKDKIKYINDEINTEKSLYKPRLDKLNLLRAEIQQNEKLGTVQAKLNNKKLIPQAAELSKYINGQIAYVNALGALRNSLEQETTSSDTESPTNGLTDDERKKAQEKSLQELENANQATLNKYKDLRNQQLIEQEYYDDLALAQELAFLKAKQKLQESFGEDTTKLKGDILDKEQELEKHFEKRKADELKKKTKTATALMQDEIDRQAKPFEKMEANMIQQGKNFEEAEKKKTAMAQADIERQQKINQVYGDAIANFGGMLGEFLAGQEMTSKQFMKNMVLLALDVLEKQVMINIAAAQAGALATPESIATWGAAGTAKGILLSSLIMAAFEAVKGIISAGFEQGGFTGGVGTKQVRGVVHSNEFVATAQAVRNPAVRQVLNVLDFAQKTNTVSSITGASLAMALGSKNQGFANGGFVGGSQSFDMAGILLMARAAMELNKTLSNGIDARTVITGKNGFANQNKRYQSLILKTRRS